MKYWLMKSEPEVFSIDDLAKSKNQTTFWDGVRNYQARNFMRDEMKIGDKVIFYHSNTEPPAAVGICEVVKEAYPDFTAFDPKSKYYDPKSKKENPTWFMVDIKLLKKFDRPVHLEEIKKNPKLKNMKLVQKGNRLSVMPITKEEFNEIVYMSNKKS
ncbi:MAG: EVE domain-containing protein [Melioribacter sp.]|uniref:EVE domain-containing protein n=1 Tax=Rosettibacter primus TaxID=3111523 RepID=UPI00247E1D5B|nr:EVE domain-containing protein [Melioribacter sp.]